MGKASVDDYRIYIRKLTRFCAAHCDTLREKDVEPVSVLELGAKSRVEAQKTGLTNIRNEKSQGGWLTSVLNASHHVNRAEDSPYSFKTIFTNILTLWGRIVG
jgi:hypothetical protein